MCMTCSLRISMDDSKAAAAAPADDPTVSLKAAKLISEPAHIGAGSDAAGWAAAMMQVMCSGMHNLRGQFWHAAHCRRQRHASLTSVIRLDIVTHTLQEICRDAKDSDRCAPIMRSVVVNWKQVLHVYVWRTRC
jgi:hypothetical protein